MGILPALLLVLIGYTGSFTRYMADDYCSVYWARRFGLLRSVWHWYMTWSGRFSAYASDWLVMLMGAHTVRIIPPVMLFLWLAATVLAVRSFLHREPAREEEWLASVLLSLMLLFAVFMVMPSVPQSFYWWNGMRSYTLPLILLTLFIALFYRWGIAKMQSMRAVILASILSFVLMFANGGLSDTYAVAQLGLLGLLTLLNLLERPRKTAPAAVLGAGALGTALALAVIALAPGNAVREISFPPHPGVFQLLSINAQGYGNLLWSMVAAPQKALALTGALCGAAWVGSMDRARPLAKPRAIGSILAVGVLLSFGAMLPASWGLSEPGPSRNMSIPVFALAVSLMAAGFVAGNNVHGHVRIRAMRVALGVCAVLALNVSGIIGAQQILMERDAYIQYARNWDTEEAQIVQAKASGAGTITVISWPNWAGLDVLSEHSKNWLNACTSGYYGIEVIGRAP